MEIKSLVLKIKILNPKKLLLMHVGEIKILKQEAKHVVTTWLPYKRSLRMCYCEKQKCDPNCPVKAQGKCRAKNSNIYWKMAGPIHYLWIIIFIANGLNSSNKRHRLPEWIKNKTFFLAPKRNRIHQQTCTELKENETPSKQKYKAGRSHPNIGWNRL